MPSSSSKIFSFEDSSCITNWGYSFFFLFLSYPKATFFLGTYEMICLIQMTSSCLILIGDEYIEGPLKILSTNMRVAASEGWNGSQKIWSCLLEHKLEVGRQGTCALSLPSPQQAAFTSANPEKGT